jgi:hypothetical protein
MPNEGTPLVCEVNTSFCRWRGVAWAAQRVSTVINHGFLDRSHYISLKCLLSYAHEAEWTPFQTYYFSENLVALGIEPRASGSVAMNSFQ